MAKPDDTDLEIEDQEIDDDLDLDEEEEDEGNDDDGDEEDDAKPVTKKDLKEFAKNLGQSVKKDIDKRFINKRHQQRDPSKKPIINQKPNKDGKGEVDESRLENIERSQRMDDFADDNDMTKKEVRYLVKTIGRIPTKADLKNPFIQGGLEKFREANKVGDNIPSGASARVFKVGGKSWEQMSSAERKDNFAARQAAILAGKRR